MKILKIVIDTNGRVIVAKETGYGIWKKSEG